MSKLGARLSGSWLGLVAALTLLAWPGGTIGRTQSASPQGQTYGLTLTPLTWSVNLDDGSERKIRGMVGRGIALHPSSQGADRQGSARPVRIVLMPLDANLANEQERGSTELKYDIFVARTASGAFEGIDLHAGAALIDLGPRVGADDPAIKASLEAGLSARPIEGVDRRDVEVGFFPFWPLIITHSIVAGSEGTRIMAMAAPERDQRNARAYFSLVEGTSASVDWKTNPNEPLKMNSRDRVCVNITRDRQTSDQPDEAQQRRMAETLEALQAGWKAAFPDDRR